MATRAHAPLRSQPAPRANGWRRALPAWLRGLRTHNGVGGDDPAAPPGGDSGAVDGPVDGVVGADNGGIGGDGPENGPLAPDGPLGPDGRWPAADELDHGGSRSDRGRKWGEVALVLVGLAIQVGITALAGRHQPERRDLDVLGVALLAAGVLAVPFRRQRPVAVLAVAFGATVTYWSADYPRGPVFFALIISLGQAVLSGHRRAAIAFLCAGFVGFPWLGSWLGTSERPELGAIIALAAWLVTLVTVMELVRSRRDRAREAARSRAEALRRRATDERMRIARELHDAVAHRMSLVSIQAGVALHLFDEQPEQARQALATIKQSSKEALVELRSILGVLRRVDEDAPRAPTPSLAHLDDLVAGANAAGLDVRVDLDPALGSIADLPRNVDLAAYRIIQESLTNVARHAGRPDALVRARREGSVLVVEVLDEGAGTADRDQPRLLVDGTSPGPTGLHGPGRAPGATGATGAAGSPGSAVPPGSAGPLASAVPPGSSGSSGSPGSAGSPGSSGPARFAGSSGSPPSGSPGSSGSSGSPGSPESAGSAGSPGSSGPARSAGSSGSPASPVSSGPAGSPGPARLPVDLPSGGNGIPGMRERASSVGGTLEVGSRPGQGFAVRARLPLGPPT